MLTLKKVRQQGSMCAHWIGLYVRLQLNLLFRPFVHGWLQNSKNKWRAFNSRNSIFTFSLVRAKWRNLGVSLTTSTLHRSTGLLRMWRKRNQHWVRQSSDSLLTHSLVRWLTEALSALPVKKTNSMKNIKKKTPRQTQWLSQSLFEAVTDKDSIQHTNSNGRLQDP